MVVAADWLLPVAGPPVPGGAVVLHDGRVAWTGRLDQLPRRWAALRLERRRGIITAGLVNAHTHLQYTRFEKLGQNQYPSFEQWAYAFEAAYLAVTDSGFWAASALDGAQRSIAAGCTVFAEIITNDEARGSLAACGVTGIEYLEAIGWHRQSWLDGARELFLARFDQPGPTPTGVSPHAPYSLDGSVIADLAQIAAARGMRLHLHLAESSVEINLYRHGDRSVLEIYGDMRDQFDLVLRGGTGLDTAFYADSVNVLGPATHLAHAIYLDRPGRDLLLRRGTQVALCPRSNASLGLGPAPVAAYLEEGHEIAVGTDSLASSPSLDLMSDLAALARIARQQGYRADDLYERLLRAATTGGAMAMGLDRDGYGAVTAGGPADLAVFDVATGGHDVAEALIRRGEGRCSMTVAGGVVIHDADRG